MPNYKFVSSGQSVDDAAVVIQTLRGDSLRANAVDNLLATRDASDDWYISAIGNPKVSEIPESYVARIRRASDGVLMRDIPVSPILRTAAVLDYVPGQTYPSGLTIDRNNVSGSIADSFWRYVYASQPVMAGMEVNGFIISPPTTVVRVNFGPWDNVYTPDNAALNVYRSGDHLNCEVYSWSGSFEQFFSVPSVDGKAYFRIVLSGTELRYQVSGSPIAPTIAPNAILHSIPPSGENYLRIGLLAQTGDPVQVQNIMIAGGTRVSTIYSIGQQQNDSAGSGIAVGNLDVEMWQVSPNHPPDYKGFAVRKVF